MRLVLAVSSLGAGGAERVASTLVNAWAERGDDVTLVATFSGRGECFYRISESVRLVYLADLAQRLGRSPFAYWARFRALRKLVRDADPDVVISFLTNVNVAVIAACQGLDVPIVACERTNPLAENKTSRFLKGLRRLTYPRARVVTVQTEDLVGPFHASCPNMRTPRAIPNPISRELQDWRPRNSASRVRHRIAAMGRLDHEKQFLLLISLFSDLAAKHPDWDLWIWGDGPLHGELREQISLLGLAERVFLPGRTTDPWAEMANSDVFVLPSLYEGFPNVLLEAMALGLPCVAFDCPYGPREISQDGKYALLVPQGDRGSFTGRLNELISSPSLRRELGQQAAASVRARYSLDSVLRMWDEIFHDLPVCTISR